MSLRSVFGGSSGAQSVSTTGAGGTPTANVVGTGTLTTFPILTIPLAKGTLKANGKWVVTLQMGCTNSGNAKSVSASLAAQDCGVSYSLVNLAGGRLEITIQAKTTSAEIATNNIAPANTTALTADLTVDNSLTILGTLTTLGEIMNVQSWSAVVSNV